MGKELRNREIPFSTEVGSLRNPIDRKKAAVLISQGKPIGAFNRGVCAIWGDGSSPAFTESVSEIKGEKRGHRPLAASLTTKEFVSLLDPNKIPPELHSTFFDADELAARTGSLCFFRGPITEAAAIKIPNSMVSRVDGVPVIQNWDSRGHRPTSALLRTVRNLGVRFPAVTSMNMSGEPEITDQGEGVKFAEEANIPFFLLDPDDQKKAVGSYTIIDVAAEGLRLIREGNIPSELLVELLGTSIDRSNSTTARSIQPLMFPADRIRGVNPRLARVAILSSLSGHRRTAEIALNAGKLI